MKGRKFSNRGGIVVRYYLIALIVILLDQVTKWLVVQYMEIGQHIKIIDNFLYLSSHRNAGAAWGILEGQMWFFYIITVAVVIGLIIYMQKLPSDQNWMKLALALMLGGAIGNFIDRLFRKEVVDFVNTYIFTYDFPIFNVADSALVVGVGIILVLTILEGKKEKEQIN
ncbi:MULTISPECIES: signal peptidase II [Bacillus]|uniref:signal peptidase II n=1 Tax=Bacillus TaxID=1386 RepID=UPI003872A7CC